MSRSNYSDDMENGWALIRWRGAVASALNGARGQAFLRELLASLDALPDKKLIAGDLMAQSGEVCALGAVGVARAIPMDALDPEDASSVADTFGIAEAMSREIVWINDEAVAYSETPEARWQRVRKWVQQQIKKEVTP